MKNWGLMRAYSLTAAVGLLVGCAGNAEPELGQDSQAIGVECANAIPTQVACHGLSYASPFSYSTTSCFKAVVLDVYNYDGNLGTTPATLQTRVSWASAVPALADCANAAVLSDLFEIVGAQFTYLGSQVAHGQVVSGACLAPSLAWNGEMSKGHSYRVTASARRADTSSAPTRAVVVETLANGVVDACLSQPVSDNESCTSDGCSPATGVITRTPLSNGTFCNVQQQGSSGATFGTCTNGICSLPSPPPSFGGASSACF